MWASTVRVVGNLSYPQTSSSKRSRVRASPGWHRKYFNKSNSFDETSRDLRSEFSLQICSRCRARLERSVDRPALVPVSGGGAQCGHPPFGSSETCHIPRHPLASGRASGPRLDGTGSTSTNRTLSTKRPETCDLNSAYKFVAGAVHG